MPTKSSGGGDVPTKFSRYDPFSWSLTNATAVSGSEEDDDVDEQSVNVT